jgi:hypothetical protein
MNIQNDRSYIDYHSINLKDFSVSERFIDGYGKVILISPLKSKHEWDLSELHLRSILCNPDGKIISSGFPKFFNYFEREESDIIASKAIASGNAFYPEKMDGSLIIRDVLFPENGKSFVHFRTRGSHELGEFYKPVMDLITSKYPALLSPLYRQGFSLLYEYTSPDNRIVIKYDEPSLTLLGGMNHYPSARPKFSIDTPNQNFIDAYISGVKPLKFHSFPSVISDIIRDVKSWVGSEGIVVWYSHNGSTYMTKIKAEDYIRIHSIKFAFGISNISKIAYAYNINDFDMLRDFAYGIGIDWEILSVLKDTFDEYINEKALRENEIVSFLSSYRGEFLDMINNRSDAFLSRKDIALFAKDFCDRNQRKEFFSICMSESTGDTKGVSDKIDAYSLGISVNRLGSFIEDGKQILSAYKEYIKNKVSKYEELKPAL